MFMYKYHSNQLKKKKKKKVQTHHYQIINAQDYSINKTKKMFSDCAIRNSEPFFWNSLDKTLKNCKSTEHF